ncbi:MAG TPA: HIT family protein [Pyrinomonadaceae bacterium]|nr:HIT family protein [Pyrinomonadaceae bacterium]
MSTSIKPECLFCRLIAGNLSARIVFEDDASLAFLDHRPLFPGHTLLVPKQHFETLADLPTELVAPLFKNAQLLSQVVEQALQAEGTFVAINNRVSQSVPHLHVHIVPRKKKDGLKGFFWPRNKYDSEAHLDEVQAAIKQGISDLRKEKQQENPHG